MNWEGQRESNWTKANRDLDVRQREIITNRAREGVERDLEEMRDREREKEHKAKEDLSRAA